MKEYPVVSWVVKENGLRVCVQAGHEFNIIIQFIDVFIKDEETLTGELNGTASFTLKILPDGQSGVLSFNGASMSDMFGGRGMEEK